MAFYLIYKISFDDKYSNSMEQKPSWETNRFSATQKIPRILWKPKVYYSVHNSPPPVSIRSQIDPVPAPIPRL
jgi:hypothetical protein